MRRVCFDVIERWAGNRIMLEGLTPRMQADYLAFATPEKFRALTATVAQ